MTEGTEDVKEVMDVMEALEAIAVAVAKVFKDGKMGASDLVVLVDLLKEADTFKDAFVGAKDIPAELKDLSQEELLLLGTKVFGIIGSVRAELSK